MYLLAICHIQRRSLDYQPWTTDRLTNQTSQVELNWPHTSQRDRLYCKASLSLEPSSQTTAWSSKQKGDALFWSGMLRNDMEWNKARSSRQDEMEKHCGCPLPLMGDIGPEENHSSLQDPQIYYKGACHLKHKQYSEKHGNSRKFTIQYNL